MKPGELSGWSMGGCHREVTFPRIKLFRVYPLLLKGNSIDERAEVWDDVVEKSEKELYETALEGGSEAESLLIRRRLVDRVSEPS